MALGSCIKVAASLVCSQKFVANKLGNHSGLQNTSLIDVISVQKEDRIHFPVFCLLMYFS